MILELDKRVQNYVRISSNNLWKILTERTVATEVGSMFTNRRNTSWPITELNTESLSTEASNHRTTTSPRLYLREYDVTRKIKRKLALILGRSVKVIIGGTACRL